jgi:hypothetical protein
MAKFSQNKTISYFLNFFQNNQNIICLERIIKIAFQLQKEQKKRFYKTLLKSTIKSQLAVPRLKISGIS